MLYLFKVPLRRSWMLLLSQNAKHFPWAMLFRAFAALQRQSKQSKPKGQYVSTAHKKQSPRPSGSKEGKTPAKMDQPFSYLRGPGQPRPSSHFPGQTSILP